MDFGLSLAFFFNMETISQGPPSAEFAKQQAEKQALLARDPLSAPRPTTPAEPAPEPASAKPVHAAPARTYSIELIYTPSQPGALGFRFGFTSGEVDLTDPSYITIEHRADLKINIDKPTEDLILKIGGTEYPVSWIGSSFRFPAKGIYGITLLRRDTNHD
jgi:hypothetical protein